MSNPQNKRKSSRYARQDRLMAQVTASTQSIDVDKASWPAKTLDISKKGLQRWKNMIGATTVEFDDTIPVKLK